MAIDPKHQPRISIHLMESNWKETPLIIVSGAIEDSVTGEWCLDQQTTANNLLRIWNQEHLGTQWAQFWIQEWKEHLDQATIYRISQDLKATTWVRLIAYLILRQSVRQALVAITNYTQ